MCKFGLFAAAVVVGVGFGWIASTKARVAPPMMMSSHTIEPMKMMVGSANLHTEALRRLFAHLPVSTSRIRLPALGGCPETAQAASGHCMRVYSYKLPIGIADPQRMKPC